MGSIQYHSKPSLGNLGGKNLLSGMKAMAQVLPMLTLGESDVTTAMSNDVFAQSAPAEDVPDVPTPSSVDGGSKFVVERVQFEEPIKEAGTAVQSSRLSAEPTDEAAAGKPALKGWARVRRLVSAPTEEAIGTVTSKRRSEELKSSTATDTERLFRVKRLMSTPGNRMDMAEVVRKVINSNAEI